VKDNDKKKTANLAPYKLTLFFTLNEVEAVFTPNTPSATVFTRFTVIRVSKKFAQVGGLPF
jgi:hypothetical protein